jgi:hypothetical protein
MLLAAGCGRLAFDPVADPDARGAIGGLRCRPFTVTAGSQALGDTYSIPITFDHASLVGAGLSVASGDDVRIGYRGVSIDRVLDGESAWDTASTKLWFRAPSPLLSGASDPDYAVCSGASGSPPANPDNVFLLFDDFSSPTLDTATWNPAAGTAITVTPTSGSLVVTGTTDMANGQALFGVVSNAVFGPDVLVELAFSIVAQSQFAQRNWKLCDGVESGEVCLVGINSDDSADKRTQFWTGTWTDLGDSTLDATTFPPQRIAQSFTSDGVVQQFENHVATGRRTGMSLQPRNVEMSYGTDVAGETFTVTFDDVLVRSYVTSDAQIRVQLAP